MINVYHNSFKQGVKEGIPIALGYISVSFAFGMMASNQGLPVWSSVLISFTNLTSAGQFAALGIIQAGGSMLEMALSQLVDQSSLFSYVAFFDSEIGGKNQYTTKSHYILWHYR